MEQKSSFEMIIKELKDRFNFQCDVVTNAKINTANCIGNVPQYGGFIAEIYYDTEKAITPRDIGFALVTMPPNKEPNILSTPLDKPISLKNALLLPTISKPVIIDSGKFPHVSLFAPKTAASTKAHTITIRLHEHFDHTTQKPILSLTMQKNNIKK